ncbi:exopolygalacturonase-like [Andrographis paniculata]|uniref:exopolygalacturonase-like n=1 Tax=Andrographis paniculata TaxID=175694 RepID=UPI0021E8BC03|nr:exopolygalacturonase-like [Andrographis paniculata]XP_051124760.1 exopolygalacturonase-like [Andrographis paniculata]
MASKAAVGVATILFCISVFEFEANAQFPGLGPPQVPPGQGPPQVPPGQGPPLVPPGQLPGPGAPQVPGQAPCLKDITKYGAAPGVDIAQALTAIWKEAIASPVPVQILIPPGNWCLSQVKLCGPSLAPIDLVVQGTVQASPDPQALPDKECEWITINYISNLTIYGGGVFDGMGEMAWKQNDCNKNQKCAKLPMNLSFNFINHTVIRDVTTKDSKNFHVNCISSHNVTFQRFMVSAPGESPNTDGIHIGRSSQITVIDSIIQTGDDCVSIGDETCEIRVQNVTCGPGHGVSIGSMGKFANEKDVNGIYVQNVTFKGTQNGVRIKTWPNGPATLCINNIHFEDIIVDNVSNPIIIDQEYCPWNQCDRTQASSIKISGVSVKNVRGTANSCEAVVLSCSSAKPCEAIEIGDVDITYVGDPVYGPIKTKCSNVQPTFVGRQNPPVCAPAPPGLPAPAA